MADDNKTELDTIADLVAAELQKRQELNNKNNSTQQTTSQTTPQTPLQLNILGQKIDFKDQAELESAITQTFQKTATENEVLRQQLAKLDPKNSAYVTGKEKEEEFNQDHYVDLMGKGSKGILEATNYALNHAIFGGKENNATELIRNAVTEAATTKATLAVYQFRERHPEFPLNNDTTKLIDGLRAELRQPFTLEGLEAAYGVAQARGLMPSRQLLDYQKQLQEAGIKLPEQGNQPQQLNLGFQPPPTIPRKSQDQGFDLAAAAETMSLQDLEAALRKAGQL